MSDNNTLQLVDETLRDGTQSLWGMMASYHMMEPVIREIAEAGYYSINLPVHVEQPKVSVRFFKEDPRILYKMFREKVKGTKSNLRIVSMGMALDITATDENKTLIKVVTRQLKEWLPEVNEYELMCCYADQIKNTFPILVPMMREMGIEPIPYMAIGHSPRHTDDFYASQVKHVVEEYKPISICIKDVNGLMTSERLRTLVPAMQQAANGTPLEFHSHGMNGLNTYNFVVAMQLGIRRLTTCCPPLAYGSSHPSVYNVVKNAEELGISHTMDMEKLNIIEERLTKIGKAYGHPVDNHPLPFDLSFYKHQIPGGVISNTRTQLEQLGIPEKMEEVLEEIPRMLEELGHPPMITPHSQFIVTQAVLNVQLGRWEHCIDAIVELAAGLFGYEEAGVPYMDQNLRDKLLSLPQAKKIKERAANYVEYINSEPSVEECKKRFGLSPNASDEDLALAAILKTNDWEKDITPGGPDSYKKYL